MNDNRHSGENVRNRCIVDLTHYNLVLLFYILPEKIRKSKGFLIFSGVIEKQHQAVMG